MNYAQTFIALISRGELPCAVMSQIVGIRGITYPPTSCIYHLPTKIQHYYHALQLLTERNI